MYIDLYGKNKIIPITRERYKLFIIFIDDFTLYK